MLEEYYNITDSHDVRTGELRKKRQKQKMN